MKYARGGRLRRWLMTTALMTALVVPALALADEDDEEERGGGGSIALPTGQRITPTAAPRALFQKLDPDLPELPGFTAGQAISTVISPDKGTLLILTSGFNRNYDAKGQLIVSASQEYVFVYDVGGAKPVKKQVLKLPNTFAGIAFAPDGKSFVVSGGVDDNVHVYAKGRNGAWAESGAPIALGHTTGLGIGVGPGSLVAGGIAVTADGRYAVVANVYNDTISKVDLEKRVKIAEIELRPGKRNSNRVGVAGGEYPFWVAIKGNNRAYVSSLRDREVVEVGLSAPYPVIRRIGVPGNPNKMILNRDQSLLFVAQDNSDKVSVIDTARGRIVDEVVTTAPAGLLDDVRKYTGSTPNALALSPDERTLYVTNGNHSSVAMIRRRGKGWAVDGLIPTGWYPNAVSVGGDGKTLYVVNGKSPAGPNPKLNDSAANQYVFQLEKAGFLTVPVPSDRDLDQLTRTVAGNNGFATKRREDDERLMRELRRRIKHVIYVIKENRTYDQVLGDLDRGNGDPSLTMFGRAITPNQHRLATGFVTLDNFYDSGEVSGNGWPWSTAGRESDFGTKALPLNYAGRGLVYEFEGQNRNLNLGVGTPQARRKLNPDTPNDPDLLPGTANVVGPDGPRGTPLGKGYIWDAVLRAKLSFRNYGCFSDLSITYPREPEPFKNKVVQNYSSNPELLRFGDVYYRGYDPAYPDFYRQREWEREFEQFVQNGRLPALQTVQMPVDHTGSLGDAISGVNTPELQVADNDYAFGKLVERVADSPYRDSTLVIGIEDDAQAGPDHVDAHRSTLYVAGPYVKQGALVRHRYTTVNVIRTIEDLLGLEHLNLNTAVARPMSEIFDLKQKEWDFRARPARLLRGTELPLPKDDGKQASLTGEGEDPASPTHDVAWWTRKTASLDFSAEDRVDSDRYNRILWEGLMRGRPYPEERSGQDLSQNREALLRTAAAEIVKVGSPLAP